MFDDEQNKIYTIKYVVSNKENADKVIEFLKDMNKHIKQLENELNQKRFVSKVKKCQLEKK